MTRSTVHLAARRARHHSAAPPSGHRDEADDELGQKLRTFVCTAFRLELQRAYFEPYEQDTMANPETH